MNKAVRKKLIQVQSDLSLFCTIILYLWNCDTKMAQMTLVTKTKPTIIASKTIMCSGYANASSMLEYIEDATQVIVKMSKRMILWARGSVAHM